MALTTSSRNACTNITIDVPMFVGHGGEQSEHALGAGSPPSRALRSILSHLPWHSKGSPHVTRISVLPLTCASSTRVRGYPKLPTDRATSVT